MKNKKVAIIGVSSNPEKYGYKIFRDLIERGYDVQGINPRLNELLGRKIYKSLKDLPSVPDMAITVVPPKITEGIVEECKELGIKEIWMQPGSESEDAVRKAKGHGINVIYNACFMVQNKIW